MRESKSEITFIHDFIRIISKYLKICKLNNIDKDFEVN